MSTWSIAPHTIQCVPQRDGMPQFTQSLPLFVGYPEALIHNLMQFGVQGAYLNDVCCIGVWLVIRALTAVGGVMHFDKL